MIKAVLMEGADLIEAEKLAEFSGPVLPRVGEIVTLPINQRYRVLAINHHKVNLASEIEIFIHVEHLPEPAPYSLDSWTT